MDKSFVQPKFVLNKHDDAVIMGISSVEVEHQQAADGISNVLNHIFSY